MPNSLHGYMSMAEEPSVIEAVGSGQVMRLQERLDRQIASMRRELVATLEQTVENAVQERTQMVRSQVLVNHAVLQKDVIALQTAMSDLRLHTVAAGQEAEEQQKAAGVASQLAMEEVRTRIDAMQSEVAELGVRLEKNSVSLREDLASLVMRMEADELTLSNWQKDSQVHLVEARTRSDALRAELREEFSHFATASDLGSKRLKEEVSELSTRMQACDNLCKRCLSALDASLGEVRRDFAALLEEMHCERDRSRLELGGRVGSAEAEINRRIEEALVACREASVSEMRSDIEGRVATAQSQSENQVSMTRQWLEDLVQEQAARWSCETRMLEEAHQQLERQCCEHNAQMQRNFNEGFEKTACQVANVEASQQQFTEAALEDVAARLSRRLEESMAWVEATAGATQDVFEAELRAVEGRMQSRQADTKKEATSQLESFAGTVRHLEQATAWALRKVDENKERAASDLRACTVQQEDAKEHWHEFKEKVAEVQMAHFTLEGRQAKLERWHQALEESRCSQKHDAAKDVEALAIELRSARGDWERHLLATQQSLESVLAEVGARIPRARHERQDRQADKAAEAAIEAAVAATAAEERASLASRHCESTQKQLENVTGRWAETMQRCVDGQQAQDRCCQDLQHKFGRLENESVVALEQLRQDSAQRLANFRSQTRDDYAALEARLHAWVASQEDLSHRHQTLCTQLDTSEKRLLAEQKHLSTEFDMSEARLLGDQRAVLAQVHDFTKAQEARMQRNSTKSNNRHEEAMHELQSVRKEIMEATRQLVGGLFAEQSSAIGKLQEELQEVESHAVHKGRSAGEGAVQELSRELRSEVGAAQDLWQQLAASQDATMQELQANFKNACRTHDEMTLQSRSEAAEMMVELRTCQETSASVMQRASTDFASLERTVHSKHEVIKDQVSLAEESLLAIARALHNEALEEVMATRFNCKAIAESVRSELLEEVLATDGNCRTSVKSLRGEMLEELSAAKLNCHTSSETLRKEVSEHAVSFDRAFARLECHSSGSAIAAAAASAAVEVRNEVLAELNNLQAQVKATDEQLLFLREELTPDVLCGVLRRDLAGSFEQVSAEQLSRFRKRWGGDVERKLDSIVQCLHSLHLKAGIPLRGTLSSILPSFRQGAEFENLT